MDRFINYLRIWRQVRDLVELLQLLAEDPEQEELHQGFFERAGIYAESIRGAAFLNLITPEQRDKLLKKLSTFYPQSYPHRQG